MLIFGLIFVSILQKGRDSIVKKLFIDSNLINIRLASYAVLLASQGCLQSALVYLGDTGANPQLQELKERLEKAVAG